MKNCVAACNKEGLMKHLEKQQKELEICEKALAEYMESKRRAFPRFYFVSSADLLDILSNGNNPIKVMQHMNKCFQVRQISSWLFFCHGMRNLWKSHVIWTEHFLLVCMSLSMQAYLPTGCGEAQAGRRDPSCWGEAQGPGHGVLCWH